jgi:hypothetical protein
MSVLVEFAVGYWLTLLNSGMGCLVQASELYTKPGLQSTADFRRVIAFYLVFAKRTLEFLLPYVAS